LLSIFKREFDEIERSAVAAAASISNLSQQTTSGTGSLTTSTSPSMTSSTSSSSVSSSAFIDHHYHKSIDLERVGAQAEGIFGERYLSYDLLHPLIFVLVFLSSSFYSHSCSLIQTQ